MPKQTSSQEVGRLLGSVRKSPNIADRWDEQREESGAGSTAAQRPVKLDEAVLHGCREIRIVCQGRRKRGN